MGPTHFERVQTEEINPDEDHSSVRSSERQNSIWSIGWFTPALMVIPFIAGCMIALIHYAVFQWLNGQDVDSSRLPQSWVSPLSTALVRTFSLLIGISVGSAYVQLLWQRLRKSYIAVGTVDKLFMMQRNPLKLASVSALKTAPLLCLIAALLPAIPVATVFPPGAIIVVSSQQNTTSSMNVPTYDLNYKGPQRGQIIDQISLLNNALFITGADGEFRDLKPYFSKIAKETAMAGTYLTMPSPCGRNCTYNVVIPGPEFSCQDGTTSNLSSIVTSMYGDKYYNGRTGAEFMPGPGQQYIAAMQPFAENNATFNFEVEWNGNKSISCKAWYSEYTLTMNFVGGSQKTDVSVKRGHLLNATYLRASELFYMPPPNIVTDGYRLWSGQNVSTAYREANVYAILLSVTDALSGAIQGYGTEGQYMANTIILETPLASYGGLGDLDIKLSGKVLQSLLQNTTISLLTLSNSVVATDVTVAPYINQYSFESRYARLVIPYGTALAVALCIIILGILALVQNGVSASGAGFLQLLCTTYGSSIINEMTRSSCLGGDENVSKGLKNLKVRFGELMSEDGPRAGFGSKGEVSELVKGRNYG